jgi:hypothetical protein
MKVWIDRNQCEANLAACESCFGQFIRTGVPDRGCILATKNNGGGGYTIFLKANHHVEILEIPADQVDLVAFEGWSKFVSFEPAFRQNEGTERLKKR